MNNNALSPDITLAIEYNFQQIAAQLGIPIRTEAAAATIGLPEDQYVSYTQSVIQQNRAVANELAQNSAVASLVDGIAAIGNQVLTMGDSITTCRYSYAEILRELLAPRGVSLSNWGVGGYTSNHALELSFNVKLREEQPAVVFLCYGVNDAKYFGDVGKMLVSHNEYVANMTAVVNTMKNNTVARIVLITPTPVVESIANHLEPGFHRDMRWRNADINRFGEALQHIGKSHSVPVIDMFAAFSDTPDPALYLDDGLHPNRAGQRLMLEHIANNLDLYE